MTQEYNNIINRIKMVAGDNDSQNPASNREQKEGKSRTSEGVRLGFPHKDCILLGGQTKKGRGSEEFFYDPEKCPDLIRHLFSPKVISNVKRYSISGQHDLAASDDKPISMDDNLLIKGNNLISMATLAGRYSGKVKMVYWDIPYNTGSGSLSYYDNFERSRWLVFIKNRVEQVLPLVSQDGVILIHCSTHQYSYLKVLLDEIIGHYVMTFNIQVRHPDRTLTGDKEYNDVIEYVLVYAKSAGFRMPKEKKEKKVDEYRYMVRELTQGTPVDFDGRKGVIFTPDEYALDRLPPARENLKVITVRGSIREKVSSGRFYVKYLQPLEGSYPPKTLFKVEGIGDDMYDYRYFYLPPQGNKNGAYLQGMPQSSSFTKKPYPNFLDFVKSYNRVNSEGNVEFRNGKKPEDLLRYFINIFTDEGDLVLDAFAGSGTTGAVALKTNRRFILCEQMDFIESVTVKRLKDVVDQLGEEGDKSFIYFELKRAESLFEDKILRSDDLELADIWTDLAKAGYIDAGLSQEPLYQDFLNMEAADQRKLLLDVLYLTERYIAYKDMDDPFYGIKEEEISVNREFYSE